MVQRMSRTLLKTLRDAPADAETLSHRLLVRAGYLRRAPGGGWTWLPLGRRVLENVTRIAREELDAAGGQEILLPDLLPHDPSGHDGDDGPHFGATDRRGARHVLAPAHEPALARLAGELTSSYKDLPATLYAIRTRHRDEARPRGGLLRGRESRVADSCTFDTTGEGRAESLRLHREAYGRILARLGLDHRAVPARTAGGRECEMFLAPAAAGEETWAECPDCGYAAATDAVTTAPVAADAAGHPPLEVLEASETPTIASLAAHLGVPASATLKNLLVTVDGELTAVGVPGDREVDLGRLRAALAPAAVELATPEDFEARPGLVRGYVGPQDRAFPYLADPRVAPGTSWITGANLPGRHARNVVAGRDFTVDRHLDVVVVEPGDPCPRCGAGLRTGRAVEVGRLVPLDPSQSAPYAPEVLGADGKPVRTAMGSGTLGLSRALAALAEQTADERGLCWPRAVAPADVHIVAAGKAVQTALALEIGEKLHAAGVRVLVDDRSGVSPGVKFADADLIGVPRILVAGRRSAEGVVELKDRRTGERTEMTVQEALTRLTA